MKIAITLLLIAMGLPIVISMGPFGFLVLLVLLIVGPHIFEQL